MSQLRTPLKCRFHWTRSNIGILTVLKFIQLMEKKHVEPLFLHLFFFIKEKNVQILCSMSKIDVFQLVLTRSFTEECEKRKILPWRHENDEIPKRD